MAGFPIIQSSGVNSGTTLAAVVNLNMPLNIESGNLLFAFAVQDNPGNVNMRMMTADWIPIFSGVHGGNVIKTRGWAQIARSGTVGASISGAGQDYAATVLCITNHSVTGILSDIQLSVVSSGLTANPSPPSLDAGLSQNWLWITLNGSDDDDEHATYWPANYNGIVQVQSAQSTSSCMLQVAAISASGQQESPGSFSLTNAQSEEWLAWTLAVPPIIDIPVPITTNNIFPIVTNKATSVNIIKQKWVPCIVYE